MSFSVNEKIGNKYRIFCNNLKRYNDPLYIDYYNLERRIRNQAEDSSAHGFKKRFDKAIKKHKNNTIKITERPIDNCIDDEVDSIEENKFKILGYANSFEDTRFKRKHVKSTYTIIGHEDICFCLCPDNIYREPPCYHTIYYLTTEEL